MDMDQAPGNSGCVGFSSFNVAAIRVCGSELARDLDREAPSWLTDLTLSRASSLPQWVLDNEAIQLGLVLGFCKRNFSLRSICTTCAL